MPNGRTGPAVLAASERVFDASRSSAGTCWPGHCRIHFGPRSGLRPAPHPWGHSTKGERNARRTHRRSSVRATPWHDLGAVLDRPPATVADPIEASGLGRGVAKDPISIHGGGPPPDSTPRASRAIAGYFPTVRQDTREVLGIVGERYRIVQHGQRGVLGAHLAHISPGNGGKAGGRARGSEGLILHAFTAFACLSQPGCSLPGPPRQGGGHWFEPSIAHW